MIGLIQPAWNRRGQPLGDDAIEPSQTGVFCFAVSFLALGKFVQ
jgi:hypothetical protein